MPRLNNLSLSIKLPIFVSGRFDRNNSYEKTNLRHTFARGRPDGCSFPTLTDPVTGSNGIRLIDHTTFNLELNITDSEPLVAGKRYAIDGFSSKASITTHVIDGPNTLTLLEGWIEFTQLSEDEDYAEALFELDGSGPMSLKHGFLRLVLKIIIEQ